MTTSSTAGDPAQEQDVCAFYCAVWRWHFYAGLFVMPFMIIITITGALYLFKDKINDVFYGDLLIVEARQTAPLPASTLTANALAAYPGMLSAYHPAAAPDQAAQVKIAMVGGEKTTAYVNPYTGDVLGGAWDAGFAETPLTWVVRNLHSLEYLGWWGNRIIEVVAGWAVLLVITGLYLWWPRKHNVGACKPSKTKGRAWWRGIHAVTGAYAATFIVFLALTGLPWSGAWDKQFYDLSYSAGLGIPNGNEDKTPPSTAPTGGALNPAPRIFETQPMPTSKGSEGAPQGIDSIIRIVEDMGIHPGYALNTPYGPNDVFTASVYPEDTMYERVIHLDQYTGEVLFDVGLAGLGVSGRAAELGINLHVDHEFNIINQILMLLACETTMLVSVSAMLMWWKRRPVGPPGAPTTPPNMHLQKGLLVIALIAGLFFPLVGISLLVVLAIEGVLWMMRRGETA